MAVLPGPAGRLVGVAGGEGCFTTFLSPGVKGIQGLVTSGSGTFFFLFPPKASWAKRPRQWPWLMGPRDFTHFPPCNQSCGTNDSSVGHLKPRQTLEYSVDKHQPVFPWFYIQGLETCNE